jgi:hypothetical protein
MDDAIVKTLAVWLAFAVILGPLLTRSSIRRNAIHGGIVAHIFHFIGATALMTVIPTFIAALIFGGGGKIAIPFAIALALTSSLSMIIFAIAERPALEAYQKAQDDRGWTEEDARSSGL